MAAGEPKITLVTGSSRGIGKAIALRLADTASGVIVHYGKDRTSARDVVRKIREKGIRSGCYKADLRRKAEAHSLVQRVEKAFGRLDILVNNFGPLQVNPWEDLDTGDWEDALRANLLSAFACTQAALPGMRRRRWGRIINIGYSRAEDLGPFQDILPYAVAKTGLLIMTRSVAASVARDGV
ncbi:MAG: SDR family NAD(P)-dependent oxidoreductase, partial [Candidatus Aminicenantales bacterium]